MIVPISTHSCPFCLRRRRFNTIVLAGHTTRGPIVVRTLRNKVKTLWHSLWPAHCVVCGGTDFPGTLDICPGCAADLIRNVPGCPRCAEPGAPDLCCGRCLKHAPAFDVVVSPYAFEFPVDLLLRGLKFRRQLANGRVLGSLLVEYLAIQSGPLP